MPFSDHPKQQQVTGILQRSLEHSRLAHAYLFTGELMPELEAVARTLAKTLNCQSPPRRNAVGDPVDSCEHCDSCRRIHADNHPDILWIRPESKLRYIRIDQMRDLMSEVHLKPTMAKYKVGILCGADRMNTESANAFLKTLEEPPSNSVLILLSTEPDRLLETILSRCLRLNFGGTGVRFDPVQMSWLRDFGDIATEQQGGLLSRYQLLGALIQQLNQKRQEIDQRLSADAGLKKHQDMTPQMEEKFENELNAAIEAEYRRTRTEVLSHLQWWLRDVWLTAANAGRQSLAFPELKPATEKIGLRLTPQEAMTNLEVMEQTQRLLYTNAQEALVLEVALIKFRL